MVSCRASNDNTYYTEVTNRKILHMSHILYTETSGSGQDIVLVSGMFGTPRYWELYLPYLHQAGFRTTTVDLLGFGRSPKPWNSDYSLDTHATALSQTILSLQLPGPAVIVGLSMSVPVILRMHQLTPDLAKRLVLLSPALYSDPATAKELSSKTGNLSGVFVRGPVAWFICNTVCRVPFVAKPIYLLMDDNTLPAGVIKDAVYHTWRSYSRSFKNCILQADGTKLTDDIGISTDIVTGEDDTSLDTQLLATMQSMHQSVTVHTLKGVHHPLYTDTDACLRIITGNKQYKS